MQLLEYKGLINETAHLTFLFVRLWWSSTTWDRRAIMNAVYLFSEKIYVRWDRTSDDHYEIEFKEENPNLPLPYMHQRPRSYKFNVFGPSFTTSIRFIGFGNSVFCLLCRQGWRYPTQKNNYPVQKTIIIIISWFSK